jgi:hypothetical protein
MSAESFLAPFTFRQVSLSGPRDALWSLLSVDSVLEKSVCQGIILLPFVERCHLSLALHKQARWIPSFRLLEICAVWCWQSVIVYIVHSELYRIIILYYNTIIIPSISLLPHLLFCHQQESVTKSFVPTYWLVVICQPLSLSTPLYKSVTYAFLFWWIILGRRHVRGYKYICHLHNTVIVSPLAPHSIQVLDSIASLKWILSIFMAFIVLSLKEIWQLSGCLHFIWAVIPTLL